MRGPNSLHEKDIYQFGDFRLDVSKRLLAKAGKPVALTPKALEVLIILVKNRGQLVEKEELMRLVWSGTFVEENNLAFNVSTLRKLLADDFASPRFIETVPKRGYRFIAEATPIVVPAISETRSGLHQDPEEVAVNAAAAAAGPAESKRAYFLIALTMAAAFAAAGAVFLHYFRATPKLSNRDTLLVADFENKTQDPVFDGTLREALMIELQQSPFFSLISEQRIQHTLRLMGRRSDSPLVPELANEVCERAGGAAVLSGSIAKLGSRYLIMVSATRCAEGGTLAAEQTEVTSKEEVLNGIMQLARHLRLRIGESAASLHRYDAPLIEATTPRLEALKAYSTSIKVGYSHGCAASVPFDLRAVELDPQFAMALSHLGRCYSNLGETELSTENTSKAYQFRDRVSDRENFSITVNYDLRVLGNLLKAQQVGELWQGTYPRDAAAYATVCGSIYQGSGKYQESIQAGEEALSLEPDMAFVYANIGFANLYLDRADEVRKTLQRASQRNLDSPDLLLVSYYAAFLRAEPAEMQSAVLRAAGRVGAEDSLANSEALTLARLGRFELAAKESRRAEELARQAGQRERAATYLAGKAVRLALVGHKLAAQETARQALTFSKGRDLEYAAAFALAETGDIAPAQALANDLRKRFPEDTFVRFTYLPVLDALSQLQSGDPARSIETLHAAGHDELATPGIDMFAFYGGLYAAYVRGQAYLALGQGSAAVAEFQKLLDHRGIVLADPAGALARLQLARGWVMAGDHTRAMAAYQDFLSLWKDADSDIPVLRQAKSEYRGLAQAVRIRRAGMPRISDIGHELHKGRAHPMS